MKRFGVREEMFSTPGDIVELYRVNNNVAVRRDGAAHSIELIRSGISVAITVPDEVLEWFVEVTHQDQLVAADWYDYVGYDDTPLHELSQDMAEDIDRFVKLLLASELRVTARGKTSALEGLVDGSWRQLVPMSIDAF